MKVEVFKCDACMSDRLPDAQWFVLVKVEAYGEPTLTIAPWNAKRVDETSDECAMHVCSRDCVMRVMAAWLETAKFDEVAASKPRTSELFGRMWFNREI